jgi:glycosyltransferase involved in cell wall biosynthesis
MKSTPELNEKRSILYMSHYFPPEVNAPAIRVSELTRSWVAAGHEVTVLTGFPNHPTGVIPQEYRGKLLMTEELDGVNVIRTYMYAARNEGILKRILNYLSFMFSSLLLGLPKLGKVDVVIGTSPQIFVAVAAYIIAIVKRAPFVFEVRDVWPEEIVAVGAIRNKMIIRLLEAMEMFLYRRATLIVAVAKGTVEILTSRGVPRYKIVLMPNGVNIEDFTAELDTGAVRRRHDLNGEFVVSYIGTHGMAHRLQTVLSAAQRLRGEKDIRFLMVGDGAEKADLERLAHDLGLDNITFLPQMPHAEAVKYYRISDVCLVPLRRAKLFTRNIPSKIYEIMASARPVLVGAEGESRELVTGANAGLWYEPEDADSLLEQVLTLYKDRKLTDRLGQNGFAYASANCRRDRIASAYLSKLIELRGC